MLAQCAKVCLSLAVTLAKASMLLRGRGYTMAPWPKVCRAAHASSKIRSIILCNSDRKSCDSWVWTDIRAFSVCRQPDSQVKASDAPNATLTVTIWPLLLTVSDSDQWLENSSPRGQSVHSRRGILHVQKGCNEGLLHPQDCYTSSRRGISCEEVQLLFFEFWQQYKSYVCAVHENL